MATAIAAGGLLHVAMGRGEPHAVAGALGVMALAIALHGVGALRAFLLGGAAGLAAWLPSSGFVATGAATAGATTLEAVGIAFVVSLVHAVRPAAAGVLAHRLARRGVPIGLATAAAWFAAEVLVPSIVPWSLGAAALGHPWLSAAADLGGPPLAGLTLGLAGGVMADLFLRAWVHVPPPEVDAAHVKLRLASAAALALLVGRGAIATEAIEASIATAPRRSVAAVHLLRKRAASPVPWPTLRGIVDDAARDADVVVLPESVGWFSSREIADDVLRSTFEGVSADVLVGAGWGPRSDAVNGIAWLHPGRADVVWYGKRRPFPVGESNAGIGRALGLEAEGVVLRETYGPATFDVGDDQVALAVCWEDLFADAGRALTAGRPSWIAVAVNDGWFGGSGADALHVLHARIRAVEARRAMVRASNLGVTSIIDPLGAVVARTDGGVVAARLPLLDHATLAVRSRGAVGAALAALVVGAALLTRPRRRASA